jgi:hypothetical protein
MKCEHCKGVGVVMSKHGGIGLNGGVWKTYSAPVTCWHCKGASEASQSK